MATDLSHVPPAGSPAGPSPGPRPTGDANAPRSAEPGLAEVAVVGAGIVGCACAARLAERGLQVVLIERESAAATGSTARSASGIRVQFSEPANIALSGASLDEYRALPQADYRATGYLFLVPPDGADAQREGVRRQRDAGHDVKVLTLAQARAIVDFDPRGIELATWCAADGVIDPHGIATAFLAQARAAGATVMTSAEVRSLRHDGDAWTLGLPGGPVRARSIVNAAGAWAGRVGALAGLPIPVQPARRIVFATGAADAPMRAPLTVDLASGVWFRPEQRRLIIGRSNPDDIGFGEGIDWAWLEPTVEPALARFPWLATHGIDRRASWWGYYEVTPDHQPLLGWRPDAPAWLDACGFSGHGVQQAAAVGRIVASLLAGETPAIDVSSLSPSRFLGGDAGARAAERLVV